MYKSIMACQDYRGGGGGGGFCYMSRPLLKALLKFIRIFLANMMGLGK
jgi:hypothetical protein